MKERFAVLLIDMQEESKIQFDLAGVDLSSTIDAQCAVLGECIRRDIPVAYFEHFSGEYSPTLPCLKALLRQVPRSWKGSKTASSCFTNPWLDDHLGEWGTDNLLIGGVNTPRCVYDSVRDAVHENREYGVYTSVDLVHDPRCACGHRPTVELFERHGRIFFDYRDLINELF